MQKIGAVLGITALAAVVLSPLPAAAFGFHLGPFHFGLPSVGHHYYRHRLYMPATPHETRTRPKHFARSETGALNESEWPFGYQAIFIAAFAKNPRQDPNLCQAPVDPNAIVGRISNVVTPIANQSELLQKLGSALGAASGYLAKLCPKEIPAQPVGRLQLMESQLVELTMALNVVRQPLLDFEQSLNADQQSRLAVASSQGSLDRQAESGNIAGGCGSLKRDRWVAQ